MALLVRTLNEVVGNWTVSASKSRSIDKGMASEIVPCGGLQSSRSQSVCEFSVFSTVVFSSGTCLPHDQ